MATLTPEQFAELQRTNPRLAEQIMRNASSNVDNARSSGADWLGTDGMPTRVSSDTATNASMKTGKQDRGVPTNAPRPPKRPSAVQDEDRAPANSGTSRGSSNNGAGKSGTADDKAAPMSTTQPPARPTDLTQSPPSTTDSQRISAEIFGPDISERAPAVTAVEASTTPGAPVPDEVAASAADPGGLSMPVDGVTGITEADIAADPSLAGPNAAVAATTRQNAGRGWRDIISDVTGALSGRNQMIAALQQTGIDWNTLSDMERTRAMTMGAQKFAASRPRQPSRQQAQR